MANPNSGYADDQPAWSLDGTKITFERNLGGGGLRLCQIGRMPRHRDLRGDKDLLDRKVQPGPHARPELKDRLLQQAQLTPQVQMVRQVR